MKSQKLDIIYCNAKEFIFPTEIIHILCFLNLSFYLADLNYYHIHFQIYSLLTVNPNLLMHAAFKKVKRQVRCQNPCIIPYCENFSLSYDFNFPASKPSEVEITNLATAINVVTCQKLTCISFTEFRNKLNKFNILQI